MPTKVLIFSANQIKKPINTNANNKGIWRGVSYGVNTTIVRAYKPKANAAIYQR